MSHLKRISFALFLGTVLVALSGSAVFAASFFPNSYTTYSDFISSMAYKPFSGDPAYDNPTNGVHQTYITPLGFNSSTTVVFKYELNGSYYPVTFTNQNLSHEYGTVMYKPGVCGSFYSPDNVWVPILSYDSALKQFVLSPKFKILELTKAYNMDNGLTLSAGTAIVMMNVDGQGEDFDDFIIAISRTEITPIPGAVWLLGSGLLGGLGFRRLRRQNHVPGC